jgi:predicted RNA-binding protein
MANYWIAAISREHVLKGVAGGFTQMCHGKQGPIKRLKAGDWLVYYSPKEQMGPSATCQRFTAIGQIADNEIFPFDMGNGFIPYRRRVDFLPCQESSILPLIDQLTFIKDKKRWGAPFRFGLVKIDKADFELIGTAMRCDADGV